MKKSIPNMFIKSIGTQTERSIGTQADICETILFYPPENSTSAFMMHNTNNFYDNPLGKINSSPRIYVGLTPQKKSLNSVYSEDIRRVQSDRRFNNSMLTADDDLHKDKEENSVILVDESNETKGQDNFIFSAVGHSGHGVVRQEDCTFPIIDNKIIHVDQNKLISVSIEGKKKSSQQDNCMSLAFDDKLKPVGRNSSKSANNEVNSKSNEQKICIENYMPIWKCNSTPRQYIKKKDRGLSKIVNLVGLSAAYEGCIPSVINGNLNPVDQNTTISVSNENDKSREEEIWDENCEPKWKENTSPRQYKSARGVGLIKIGEVVGNATKCFKKNDESDRFSMEEDIEPTTSKTMASIPMADHDSTDTTARQSTPAIDLELCPEKTTIDFSLPSDSIGVTDPPSPHDRSNVDISFNQGHGLISVSNVLGQALMATDKANENVIIDMRIRAPNRAGKMCKRAQKLNGIITEPNAGCGNSNARLIRPNGSVKPKKAVIRPNTEDKYVCSNCSKVYNSRKGVESHMKGKCQKAYPGVWCDTEFKTKGELRLHDKRGCKPKPVPNRTERANKLCEYCGKEFSCNSVFYGHLKGHLNGKCYLCTTCGKRFNRRGHLRTHEKSVHTKEMPWYNCTRCPHRSRLRKHIMAHEKIHDVPEGAEVPTPFKCHCGKGFISGHMLTVHNNLVHKPKKCNLCGELLGNRKLLKEHKTMVHNISDFGKLNSAGSSTQTCLICSETFSGQYCKIRLDEHLNFAHNIAVGPGIRLPCDMCYRSFRFFAAYIFHKSTLHMAKVTESELRNMIERLSLEGEMSSQGDHPKRVNNSAERSKFGSVRNCPICAQTFLTLQGLDCHLKAKHSIGNIGPDESIQCDLCIKTFKSFANYINHSSSFHNMVIDESELISKNESLTWFKEGGLYECDQCDKKYSTKLKLQTHIFIKHSSTPSGFSCKACNVSFQTRKEYYNHNYSIGHLPVEKLTCNICHKTFKHMGSLWSHKIVHSTEPRISCPDCGSKFKRKGDYTKHRHEKHKGDSDSNVFQLSTTHIKIESSEESYSSHLVDEDSLKVTGKRTGTQINACETLNRLQENSISIISGNTHEPGLNINSASQVVKISLCQDSNRLPVDNVLNVTEKTDENVLDDTAKSSSINENLSSSFSKDKEYVFVFIFNDEVKSKRKVSGKRRSTRRSLNSSLCLDSMDLLDISSALDDETIPIEDERVTKIGCTTTFIKEAATKVMGEMFAKNKSKSTNLADVQAEYFIMLKSFTPSSRQKKSTPRQTSRKSKKVPISDQDPGYHFMCTTGLQMSPADTSILPENDSREEGAVPEPFGTSMSDQGSFVNVYKKGRRKLNRQVEVKVESGNNETKEDKYKPEESIANTTDLQTTTSSISIYAEDLGEISDPPCDDIMSDDGSDEDFTKVKRKSKRRKKTVSRIFTANVETAETANAEGMFICNQCNQSYRSLRSLKEHMKKSCKGVENPYNCNRCNNQFRTKGALNKHIRTVCRPKPRSREKVPKVCEYCGKEFTDQSTLLQHVEFHKNLRRHKCPECGKGFNAPHVRNQHLKFVHRKEKPWFYCSRCGIRSLSRKHIMAHEQTHDLPEGAEVPKPFLCQCGKGFISQHMLTIHVNFNHKPKKCTICGETLNTLYLLQKHKQLAHNIGSVTKAKVAQSCPICHKVLSSVITLSHHLESLHNIGKPGENQTLKCGICTKSYNWFGSFIRHRRSHHKEEVTEYELRTMSARLAAEDSGAGTINECDRCHKRFDTKAKLQTHVYRTHISPATSLHCEKCDIQFGTRTEFYAHKYSARHVPPEKRSCLICHKTFDNLRCLWGHRFVHATTSLCCPECGSKFKRKGDYTKHMRDKHGVSNASAMSGAMNAMSGAMNAMNSM